MGHVQELAYHSLLARTLAERVDVLKGCLTKLAAQVDNGEHGGEVASVLLQLDEMHRGIGHTLNSLIHKHVQLIHNRLDLVKLYEGFANFILESERVEQKSDGCRNSLDMLIEGFQLVTRFTGGNPDGLVRYLSKKQAPGIPQEYDDGYYMHYEKLVSMIKLAEEQLYEKQFREALDAMKTGAQSLMEMFDTITERSTRIELLYELSNVFDEPFGVYR